MSSGGVGIRGRRHRKPRAMSAGLDIIAVREVRRTGSSLRRRLTLGMVLTTNAQVHASEIDIKSPSNGPL